MFAIVNPWLNPVGRLIVTAFGFSAILFGYYQLLNLFVTRTALAEQTSARVLEAVRLDEQNIQLAFQWQEFTTTLARRNKVSLVPLPVIGGIHALEVRAPKSGSIVAIDFDALNRLFKNKNLKAIYLAKPTSEITVGQTLIQTTQDCFSSEAEFLRAVSSVFSVQAAGSFSAETYPLFRRIMLLSETNNNIELTTDLEIYGEAICQATRLYPVTGAIHSLNIIKNCRRSDSLDWRSCLAFSLPALYSPNTLDKHLHSSMAVILTLLERSATYKDTFGQALSLQILRKTILALLEGGNSKDALNIFGVYGTRMLNYWYRSFSERGIIDNESVSLSASYFLDFCAMHQTHGNFNIKPADFIELFAKSLLRDNATEAERLIYDQLALRYAAITGNTPSSTLQPDSAFKAFIETPSILWERHSISASAFLICTPIWKPLTPETTDRLTKLLLAQGDLVATEILSSLSLAISGKLSAFSDHKLYKPFLAEAQKRIDAYVTRCKAQANAAKTQALKTPKGSVI